MTSHDIAVSFLNDAWGGTAATDRNLHIDSIEAGGQRVAGSAGTLYSASTQHFTVPALLNG